MRELGPLHLPIHAFNALWTVTATGLGVVCLIALLTPQLLRPECNGRGRAD